MTLFVNKRKRKTYVQHKGIPKLKLLFSNQFIKGKKENIPNNFVFLRKGRLKMNENIIAL